MAKIVQRVMSKSDEELEGRIAKYSGKQQLDKFAKSETGRNIGSWAFIIGFLIALIAGIVASVNAVSPNAVQLDMSSLTLLLVIIGLIVGIVNITSGETVMFLVCAIAIMLSPSGFGALGAVIGGNVIAAFLNSLTSTIAVFVAPAAVIVALKGIYATARQA